jgi:hypothetical protein
VTGVGMKSLRSQALDLNKLGWRVERIALALDCDVNDVTEWIYGKPKAALGKKKRGRQLGETSPAQKAKVAGRPPLFEPLNPDEPIHAAHLWPRGLGGCDDPLCVVGMPAHAHDEYDGRRGTKRRDILPALLTQGYVAEIQHAVGHANGDLIAVLERLTGDKYAPAGRASG